MVFFFSSNGNSLIFIGDVPDSGSTKCQNLYGSRQVREYYLCVYNLRVLFLDEDLIKYAEAEDFWFHVDDLSSAHVYLRSQGRWTLDTIPEDVIIDCAQLVKANSIEGSKKNDIKVVYTPASNLRKEASFDVGQVSFYNTKLLRYVKVERRIADIVNRLKKTKEEKVVDFEAEKAARLMTDKARRKNETERVKAEEERERRKKQEEADMKGYVSVFNNTSSMSIFPMTADNDIDPLDEYMLTIETEVKSLVGNSVDGKKLNVNNISTIRLEDELDEDEGEPEDRLDIEALKNLSTEEIIALAQRRVKKKDISQVDHHSVKYQPFRKEFYVESPEISRMTEEEVQSYRNELDGIKIRGIKCPRPIRKWTQCGLDQRVLEVIKRCEYEKPTPIQAQAIPAVMNGRDIIGIAKTGSGKTIAFVLPMLRHVLDQSKLTMNDGPIALIMTPTRELAMQTFSECKKFAHVLGVKVVCAYGGAPIKDQIADLKRGAEILICTPGRLIDLLLANSGKVTNLRRVTYLVLDEADRMFDMGFGPQVLKIVDNIRPDKQAVLFSATFPQNMEALARKILMKPLEIVVGLRSTVSADVEQLVEVVDEESKFLKLLDVLGRWYETKSNRILIFVDRQDAADSLLKDLIRRGYHCNSLHGGKDQADRDCAISDFKCGIIPILIATSVAARGLDVKDLKLVINYECPNHMEDYVHRVGRTGRAGNKGTAITLITPDQEKYAPEIVKALKASSAHIPLALQKLADNFVEKLKSGQASTVGSGFGGKGLERIDEEHERVKRTQKILLGPEEALDSDEEEEVLAVATGMDQLKKLKTETTSTLATTSVVQKPTTKNIGTGLTPDLMATLRKINEKISSQAGTEEEVLDPLAALNARYKSATSTSGEVMAIYDRPTATGGAPVAKSYFAEFEVNDYPQAARFKITHKDTLSTIMDFTGAVLAVKGEYIPQGKSAKDGQRRLFIRVDSESEVAVEKALKELRRMLFEAMTEAAERGTLDALRYGL